MKTIISDNIYQMFKDTVICPLCKSIFINPVMCLKCQNTYCQKCIDKWKQENEKCPDNCDEPNYQECKGKIDILSNLKFICVGCGIEITYKEAKDHHESCCPDKTSDNIDIFKKLRKAPEVKMVKLSSQEVDALKKQGSEMSYITVITLGASHVGKTSLIETFINGKCTLLGIPTLGTPNYFVTYKLSDGSMVNVNLWDTSGQERYRALNLRYYKNADCCLLVYDITDKNSFNECKNYYNPKLIEECKNNIQVILLGNKSDCEQNRKVLPEEGAGFALENNYIFMETSCVRNDNVANAFEALIELTNIEQKKRKKDKNNDSINLGKTKPKKRSKLC